METIELKIYTEVKLFHTVNLWNHIISFQYTVDIPILKERENGYRFQLSLIP